MKYVRYDRHLREKARQKRATGQMIKTIAADLSVPISRVTYWVKDIKLTPEQLEANRKPGRAIAAKARTLSAQNRRRSFQKTGRDKIRNSYNELYLAGCMLYWGEGSKERNRLILVNSDPEMHKLFLRFLRTCFAVTDADIRFRLTCYAKNKKDASTLETFWLEKLELDRTSMLSSIVNPAGKQDRKKRRLLKYGTVRVEVLKSTALVQEIYGAIQEFSGIEAERWIDGIE